MIGFATYLAAFLGALSLIVAGAFSLRLVLARHNGAKATNWMRNSTIVRQLLRALVLAVGFSAAAAVLAVLGWIF